MGVAAAIRTRLAQFIAPPSTLDPESRALNSGNLWPSFGVFEAGRILPTLSPTAAFRIPGVSAAVQLLAQEVATLPLKVFEGEGADRREAKRHPAYNLLRWMPNELQTASNWRQTSVVHETLFGNSFTEIVFDSSGRPRALWPLHPRQVGVFTDDERREIMYEFQPTNGDRRLITPDRMLHIKWLTSGSGLWGESPVLRCSDAIGLTDAAADFAAKFYGSGAHLSGVLSHPGSLSETSFNTLKETWKEAHEGQVNAHSVAILEEGMEWTPTSVTPEDGQMLPTREFQIREVARIFGVPVFRIGGSSDTNTYSNIEQETIAFYRNSLRPLLTNWEQEIDAKLLGPNFFSDFDLSDVLRPDVTVRFNGYASALTAGWLTVDEVRANEGLPPLPEEEAEEQEAEEAEEAEDDEDRALLMLAPVLEALVERVLVRQRHVLADADEGKALHFFDHQPAVWANELEPWLRSAELAGVDVPFAHSVELAERFTITHAADLVLSDDCSNGLWNAADLTQEILDGLR